MEKTEKLKVFCIEKMENYQVIFKPNEEDLTHEDFSNINFVSDSGRLSFLNTNGFEIATVDFYFENFSKKTIKKFIEVLKNGEGVISNQKERDFGDGGFFIILEKIF